MPLNFLFATVSHPTAKVSGHFNAVGGLQAACTAAVNSSSDPYSDTIAHSHSLTNITAYTMTTYGPSFIVHSVVPLRDRLDAVLKQQMDLSQGRPDRAARLGYGDEGIKALFNGEELLERLKMKRKRADEKLQSFERGVSLCAARTADDDAARDVDDDSDEDAAAAAAARAADMVEALIKNRPDLVTLLYALGHKLRPSLRRAIEQACEGLGQVTHSQLAAQEAAGDSRELKNAQAEVTRLEEPLETTATARDGYRQSYEAEHGRLEASTDVVRTLRENETNLGARVEALKEQLQDAQRETANADRDVALLELQKADLEARLGNAVKDAETELRARAAQVLKSS